MAVILPETNLNKAQSLAITGHDVQFPPSSAIVSSEDLQPLLLKKQRGSRLAKVTNGLGFGHDPPARLKRADTYRSTDLQMPHKYLDTDEKRLVEETRNEERRSAHTTDADCGTRPQRTT